MTQRLYLLRPTALKCMAATGILCCLAGCFPLVAGTVVTGGTMLNDPRTPGNFVDDERIELLVNGKIADDQKLNKQNRHINVTSYNNRVLLTGEVTEPELQELASRLALGVEGVRGVFSELRVAPLSSLGDRSKDSYITGKIKSRMLLTRDFPSSHIKIVTEARVVYLMGLVTPEQADIAAQLARRAAGVEKVVRLFEDRSP